MLKIEKRDRIFVGSFQAMNCPCEILVDSADETLARRLLLLSSQEAWRIEEKFSRYVRGNIVDRINSSGGQSVKVDDETAELIDFSAQCFQLSNGLFDITSGILRKVWKFNGASQTPLKEELEKILPLVGWNKVKWNKPVLQLLPGMEIDLGGVGKEYAVDRVLGILKEASKAAVLVNFGGDIAVSGARENDEPWIVGIEDANQENKAQAVLKLSKGAVATSGDSKKFVMINGQRRGHILNPHDGWPVADAPRSVTVAAPTCTQAGFLSTVGILNGKQAPEFLAEAGVQYWCH